MISLISVYFLKVMFLLRLNEMSGGSVKIRITSLSF